VAKTPKKLTPKSDAASKPVVPTKARKAGAPTVPTPRPNTKQAKLIALLRRPGGATIADLVKATGWQSHTIRGAISGALKKKLGIKITSEKAKDGERVYHIDK
jgi:hypothetical protein